MNVLLRRICSFYKFTRYEFARPASPLARVEALLLRKPSDALRSMHPEVRRTRSYIPATLFARRMDTYCGQSAKFLGSKVTQKLWLDRCFPDHAPPVLCYVGVNQLVPVAPSIGRRPVADLPELVRERGGLFLKPSDQGMGRGAAHLVDCQGVIELNGVPIADEPLRRLAETQWRGYVASDIIRNSLWAGKFYDRTLNTVRILTGVRPATGTPVILAALLKIGTDATFPVDNFHSGLNLTAKIDLATGRLTSAVTMLPGKGGGRRLLEAHPQSQVSITGDAVPDWPAVKSLMLDIAAHLPFPGLVGWDIALTPTGIVVVEGNGRPGINIHEAHESLLAGPEQRSYFSDMNIRPRRPRWRERIAGLGVRGQAGHQTG